jgi:hypothetical protein
MAAIHSQRLSLKMVRELVTSQRVLRNNERKKKISPAMRAAAAHPLEGLSSVAGLIQASDLCCPHVVGIQKGTGIDAQRNTRKQIPARKIRQAA